MILKPGESCAHVLQKSCHNVQYSAVETEKLLPSMIRLSREVTSSLKAERAWCATCRGETRPWCRAVSARWGTRARVSSATGFHPPC